MSPTNFSKYTIYGLLYCTVSYLYAQAPSWSITATDYQYSMTITARLKTRAIISTDPNDIVGVFVGTELRGVAQPTVNASGGVRLAFLQVYSNRSSNETLSFRIYDASDDQIINAITSLSFQSDLSVGSIANPYLITDNYGPTDIILSTNSIDENEPPSTVLALLSAQDQDMGETFSFSLVAGAGDTDNASFTIQGSNLISNTSLNFEAQSRHSIRIRATDSKNEYTEEAVTIEVNDINDPPSGIVLSSYDVAENTPIGSSTALLSTTDEDINPSTYTYRLVSGGGATDNTSFLIQNEELYLNLSPDFEAQSSFQIRIRSTDDSGLSIEEAITINVTDVNEPPIDVVPNVLSLSEGTSVQTVVSTLSASDPDAGDTHSFRLLNEAEIFGINGLDMILLQPLDYEARALYFLDIEITDANGLQATSQIRVDVGNDNEAPSDIVFTPENVDELAMVGSLIGRLSTIDEDQDINFNYSLVSGTGSEQNSFFTISGDEVQLLQPLNYEQEVRYSFRIQSNEVADPSSFVQRVFVIEVRNVNEPPTNLMLSSTEVEENRLPGTSVGEITFDDPDLPEIHSISFVSGTGSADNDLFIIDGRTLKTRQRLNFEAASTRSIRIQVEDGGGLNIEQSFSINVLDTNEEPTNLSISSNEVAENSPSGTLVGQLSTLDPDMGGTITYSLLSTPDIGKFRIEGDRVLTNQELDYEDQIFYTLEVQATDDASSTTTQEFVIILINSNEPSTALRITSDGFRENLASDSRVAIFMTDDPDSEETFTYTLTGGDGSDDNDAFTIRNNELRNRMPFDFEQKSSYQIRVSVSDQGGHTLEESFVVQIIDINEAPTAISFSPQLLPENQPLGTLVGTLSAEDQDASEQLTYTLVEGMGSKDNTKFFMSNDELFAAEIFDFESSDRFEIRVRVADRGNLFFERSLTIPIQNENDPHTNLQLSSNNIQENRPAGSVVGTLSVDDPETTPITYLITESSLAKAFRIEDDQLLSNRVFDFEHQSLLRLTIEASDPDDNVISKTFEINITDVDDPPTAITLSSDKFPENMPEGTLVGRFSLIDEDGGNSEEEVVYTLLEGDDYVDNTFFRVINRNELVSAAPLNFEEQSYRTVHVRATNSTTLDINTPIIITIQDTNDSPTAITLSETSIAENEPPGSLVALISCNDQDGSNDCSFELSGDVASVAYFEVRGNRLYSLASFNYEEVAQYTFTVSAVDRMGAGIDEGVRIEVRDTNDPPVIQEAEVPLSVPEHSPEGTLVGSVYASDEDPGQQLRYQLFLSSNPEIKNSNYSIDASSGQIYTKNSEQLDYETSATQRIEVIVTDDGTPTQSHRAYFDIELLDVAENTLPAALVITPNGDGMNDLWIITNVYIYSDLELTIFNNLGQMVYQTHNYQNDWDATYEGEPLPRGVYHYVLKDDSGQISYRGSISVIK